MIGSGEAEFRAVTSAVRAAVARSRLDAGVNIAALLVDLDVAVDADYRQLFMCWHLTRVLGPSLTEMVPPSIVRSVVSQEQRANTSPLLSTLTTAMQMRDASSEGPLLKEDGVRGADGGDVLCASGHWTYWCSDDPGSAV